MRNPELHPEAIYHVYNRGVNKQKIFLDRRDYLRFLNKMDGYAIKFTIRILGFCLMPNHFHLLIKDKSENRGSLTEKSKISYFMKNLQSSYGKYFNAKYKHSGHVFQGPYKNKIITDDAYLDQVIIYIHENPVRKNYVANPKIWPYSSANGIN